jgi:hypothetical protein
VPPRPIATDILGMALSMERAVVEGAAATFREILAEAPPIPRAGIPDDIAQFVLTAYLDLCHRRGHRHRRFVLALTLALAALKEFPLHPRPHDTLADSASRALRPAAPGHGAVGRRPTHPGRHGVEQRLNEMRRW